MAKKKPEPTSKPVNDSAENPSPIAAFMERMTHHVSVEIPDWLESIGLPRDLNLATQVAIAELGELVLYDDIDELTVDRCVELIRAAHAKQQWGSHRAVEQGFNPSTEKTVTLSPQHLRAIYDVNQDTLRKRIRDGVIVAEMINTKSYRVPLDKLPKDWRAKLDKATGRSE
jgi:hypothetical protein